MIKYNNQFHKESSEKAMKAIQEMKKTPMSHEDYQREYARHVKMGKEAKKLEEEYLASQGSNGQSDIKE